MAHGKFHGPWKFPWAALFHLGRAVNATQPPPGNLLRDLAFVFFQAVVFEVYPAYIYFGYIVIWFGGPKTNKPTTCQ